MTSPELPGSPLAASGRPEGVPDLALAELRAQDVSAADFGGAVANVRWTGEDRLVVQLPGAPDQHVQVLPEDPGTGLVGRTDLKAGTAEEPHLLRIGPRVDPHVVSSVLVHEISHLAQERAAQVAGVGQGLVRGSLSPVREGTDHCLTPRLDEHAHLSRKWRATADPQARGRIAAAIEAIAADIARRGHTPPSPPWHSRPPSTHPAGPPPAAPPDAAVPGLPPREPAGAAGTAGMAGAAHVPGAEETAGMPGPAALAKLRSLIDALSGEPSGPSLADALNGRADAASAPDGHTAAPGSLAAALNGGRPGNAALTAAIRAEAERAGLAPGQPGAAAKIVALARAGELGPEHVTALRGRPALPETAAADAVARAAGLMGARARTYGPGLLDLEIPGHPPIPVEIRPATQAPHKNGSLPAGRTAQESGGC
ncbi:hypothetical protein ACFQQB_61785 [Nonomuraea rubra]|uniref:hypothetical protein n=1 Tax=Nonomuraea rubra TaxID=46180 RepID=UPI0036217963